MRLVKRALLSIVVTAAGVLALPATAQAIFEGCEVSTDVYNFICSSQDGQTLVGTPGPKLDYFIIRDNNVTVYTEGIGDRTQGDEIFLDGNHAHNASGHITGTIVHADVYYDGDTDPTNDVPLPSAPNIYIPGGVNAYVSAEATIDTTVYGSPDLDHVDDGGQNNDHIAINTNTNLTFYGNDGNDDVDTYGPSGTTLIGGNGNDSVAMIVAGTGSIVLDGGEGDDWVTDRSSGTTTTASFASRATGRVAIKGGRGKDKLTALRRYDVVHAGRGYDVCKVVRRVETHGCEKIVRV